MWSNKIVIFLASISNIFIELWIEMGRALPFQVLGLTGWYISYGKGTFSNSWGGHMLVLLIALLSPIEADMLGAVVSQIRYSLVVILGLNSVSEVQYKGMMTDRWWKVSTGIIDVVKSEV